MPLKLSCACECAVFVSVEHKFIRCFCTRMVQMSTPSEWCAVVNVSVVLSVCYGINVVHTELQVV